MSAREITIVGVKLLAIAFSLFLLWQASGAIVIILVGVVMGVALSAAADGIARFAPLSREASLAVLIVLILVAVGLGIWSGGTALISQLQSYLQAVQTVGRQLQEFLARGAGGLFPEGSINLDEAMPRFATVFGSAARLFAAMSEIAVNVVIIAFLAVFFAWQPSVYRSGLLALVPQDKRFTIGQAIDRAAMAIRKWLAGQTISMVVVFFATLISLLLVGMPYAVLLAFISGVLTFVPTLGPFLSGVAIVIAGLSVSVELGLYGLGVYILIQFIETYMVTPLVQNEAVHLPPAATLGAQLVGGAIFGTLGFAFAVPLAAALRALVLELYVDRMADPKA